MGLLVGNLAQVRGLLVDGLGLPVKDEEAGDFVEFRLWETRLCVDRAGQDPYGHDTRAVVAFSVERLEDAAKGLESEGSPSTACGASTASRCASPSGRGWS